MSYKMNKMASAVRTMEKYLPSTFHSFGYTFLFNNMVKLAGTAGLRVEKLNAREVEVTLRNTKKIQNHIGGLHACSMVLAAESATGMIVGMNVPDTHLPLIKTMKIDFVRRCVGDIRATAHLTADDLKRINEDDKGDVKIDVVVKDESGKEPIKAEMIWAWINKKRNNRGS